MVSAGMPNPVPERFAVLRAACGVAVDWQLVVSVAMAVAGEGEDEVVSREVRLLCSSVKLSGRVVKRVVVGHVVRLTYS